MKYETVNGIVGDLVERLQNSSPPASLTDVAVAHDLVHVCSMRCDNLALRRSADFAEFVQRFKAVQP